MTLSGAAKGARLEDDVDARHVDRRHVRDVDLRHRPRRRDRRLVDHRGRHELLRPHDVPRLQRSELRQRPARRQRHRLARERIAAVAVAARRRSPASRRPRERVGASVTITGTNFTGATDVKFNGRRLRSPSAARLRSRATVPNCSSTRNDLGHDAERHRDEHVVSHRHRLRLVSSSSATPASRTARAAPWVASAGVDRQLDLRAARTAARGRRGWTATAPPTPTRSTRQVTIPAASTSATLDVLAAHRHGRDDHHDRVRHAEGADPQLLRHGARDARDVLEPEPEHRLLAEVVQPQLVQRADRSRSTSSAPRTRSLQTSFVVDDFALNVQ